MELTKLHSLHAIAYAAHHLEAFLQKAQGNQETDSDALINVLTVVASLNQVLASAPERTAPNLKLMFQPLLNKLSKLLNAKLSADMTPAQLAKSKFGAEGERLYKMLKSLGYNEYSYSFWNFIVNAIESNNEEPTLSM